MLKSVVKMFLSNGQYRNYFCKEVCAYLKESFADEPTETMLMFKMLTVVISTALVLSTPFYVVANIYERDAVGLSINVLGAVVPVWILNNILDFKCLVKTANEEALRHSSRK